MTNEEIQQIFFAECEESLAAAEAGLAACRTGTQDADTVNAIFRAVHSIKGGAGAFGFTALQAYTHIFETLLSDVREGSVPLTDALIGLMLRALDTLSDHVNAARDDGQPPADAKLLAELTAAQANGSPVADSPAPTPVPAAKPDVVAEDAGGDLDLDIDLDALLDDIAGDFLVVPGPTWAVHVRPHAGAMRNGSEPLLMLRELANLGGECVRCDVSYVPPLHAIDVTRGYLGWTFAMPESASADSVRDIFDFVGEECSLTMGEGAGMPPLSSKVAAEAKPQAVVVTSKPEVATATEQPAQASAGPAPAATGHSIRIDLPKLDRLIDSVGELVIAQAMMAQRLSGAGIVAAEELALLESLTRDIQEGAMAIRAQPISAVFSRVPRILRELTTSTGKHVNLKVLGAATELDKTVIERLGEPLTHLIRNAVDHGIETPEKRLAAGKGAEGTLTLSAEHRSGRILIRIADDGAGIDRQRVLAKAIEKGLVASEAQLTREEIDNLIFAPGFSTAATISNVSGRGVGMDVVRQNVKELGGRVTIESEQGKGTVFTLTLPLTLAISDGMIVNVGDQMLVVPLAHIVESLRPGPGDVQGFGMDRHMLNVRGRFIPVLSLGQALGELSTLKSPEEGVLIVVDTELAGQAALLVDGIFDQRQFVIKSLDTHYRAVEGVAGATILGDGRVALILDIDALVNRTLAVPDRQAA